jgi:hypothetical protein
VRGQGQRQRALPVLWLLVLVGCAPGRGEGNLDGVVTLPDCGKSASSYSMRPNYFAAEDVGRGAIEIRVQRDTDMPKFSDGLSLTVTDTEEVRARWLNQPIDISAQFQGLISASVYFNATCEVDLLDSKPLLPALQALQGQIVFQSIYVPDTKDTRIEFELLATRFADINEPSERHATLQGQVSFEYERGRPAQRFP